MPLVILCTRPAKHQIAISAEPEFQHLTITNKNAKIRYALGFVCLSALIVSLPHQPLDVSATTQNLSLPVYLQGQYGQSVVLNQQEQDYFTQYGGSAVKMRYGINSALLISTTSPLRHLHAPDECLRGLGFAVEYQGIQYLPIPTALYTATAADGKKWRVAVSFYSAPDQFTSNVSELVWRWLQHPQRTWHALQRITPLHTPITEAQAWDRALFTALDLTSTTHAQEHHYAKTH